MKKIAIENLNALYNAIGEKYPLYLPVSDGTETNFAAYKEGVNVDLNRLKTVKSPKDLFFPQSEEMMRFEKKEGKWQFFDSAKKRDPFVLFGVRACDFKAFEVLDNVFLNDPKDTYYAHRREAAIIVTLACFKPNQACFCPVFGLDATKPQGDITAYLTAENLYLDANTEKGEALFSALGDMSGKLKDAQKADEKTVAAEQKAAKERFDKLPFKNLDLTPFKADMKETFADEKWQKLSQGCLGCGACTFVCPTCQCFDIRDFKAKDGVIRFRCWDSCMYSDFTQMAGGNPRTTQTQRFRQRFMHKLVYYPKRYGGTYSCVGCGRCVEKCPQHLNIVKVIKEFSKDGKEGE